ncbi:MAG: DUF4835 family protein [Muribaculaceae bacterium]|nr:DUF4835 family protein [Muribaculaceae bacterium]
MKRAIFTILLLLATSLWVVADEMELNCEVEVNAQQVANANKEVFDALKDAISEYMNSTKWTDAHFAINERIQCKLFFAIKEYNDGTNQMKGELTIQSQRPVYNSSYTTTLINFKDTKIDFTYQSGEQLVFSQQEWQSSLTGLLNFYAYLIIAIDCDTFAPNGGDPYYDQAAAVVRMAQSTGESGWKAFEDNKNRSAVLSAYTDKATAPIRTLLYDYHRQGLDQMVVSVDKGRNTITKSLENLKKIYDVQPMSVALSMFRDAKLDELINVYSKANTSEKQQVYDLLSEIYPTELERLKKIKEETY